MFETNKGLNSVTGHLILRCEPAWNSIFIFKSMASVIVSSQRQQPSLVRVFAFLQYLSQSISMPIQTRLSTLNYGSSAHCSTSISLPYLKQSSTTSTPWPTLLETVFLIVPTLHDFVSRTAHCKRGCQRRKCTGYPWSTVPSLAIPIKVTGRKPQWRP